MTDRISRGVVALHKGRLVDDEADECEEDLRQSWRTSVHDMPKCLVFHGLGDETLTVWRIFGACEEYVKQVMVGDQPMTISAACCEFMLLKPGLYEFRPADGETELPEEFMPEEYAVGLEWAALIKDTFPPCVP